MQQEKRDAKEDKQEGGEDAAATIKRKPWTHKEDESLRELVMWSASGTGKVKWSDVATRMPGRRGHGREVGRTGPEPARADGATAQEPVDATGGGFRKSENENYDGFRKNENDGGFRKNEND
ncbi:hypothetical protein THAOC_17616 [Thalassiosira oceanica]|uniref:Myb-like domain-containing protein n=1 Tax=Thalassiosira oceanica TaxID=159749 RepID=K0S959_THAOC|nr:hypothetical protein THAOC_17616 [Thalassiosira oceanica]|eukprot:EJK61825.1 hypothetical protein THAOC_17616 [Thalassiosira oceanica]